MTQDIAFRDIQVRSSEIEVRRIGVQDLWQALKQGLDDFNAKPTYGVFLLIIYPLFAILLTLFLVGGNLLYLAFPVVAGLTLLGPAFSIALFEMSRRRERGLEVSWRSAFGFVHTSSFAPIAALSLLMMLLYVAWLFMAEFLYVGTFGVEAPASVSSFVHELVTTRHGTGLIMYGTGLGFIFSVTVLAVSVVGFPLLLDRPASCATAIAVSTRAVTSNPLVMTVWAVTVVVLLAAGAFLFLMGLPVILPILGHATWHLYRKVVAP